MKHEKLNNATRITMNSEESDRLAASISATEAIPTTSMKVGVVKRLLNLTAMILENRDSVPVMMYAEAAIVDMLLALGMEDDRNAEASKRSKAKPEVSSSKSRTSPVPSPSI